MGLLDAYQDSTDAALRVMTSRPIEAEPPKPKHSAWSLPYKSVGDYIENQLTIPRAMAAGAAEVAGNIMDKAGAFGQVAAASGGITPGFDPSYSQTTPTLSSLITGQPGVSSERRQSIEAMETLKRDGINWRTDEARQAYRFGADLRPDPLTAGTAENLVFSLTKGLTKAIGAAVTLGPVGGAVAFGGSEGMTAAEDLANQGVDQTTRTKVGAVAGVMNAAGVLLPVAGKTLAQTAALVVAGGPASFMAQQYATREILRNADYGKIAEQYDPLDPVGLAVATLLPAGFAAYAKRGGFASQKPANVRDNADSVSPVTDNSPIAATPDAIDAAMVQNLTIARDVHESVKIPDIAPVQSKPASLDEFVAWAKGQAESGIATEEAEMRRIASGELTETQAMRPENFRVTADEAKDRLSSLAVMRSELDQKYSVSNPLMKMAYELNPGTPAVKESLTVQSDPAVVKDSSTTETPDAYRARVEALTKEQPDLVARLDDAGQPVKLSDELAAIKKEAQDGTETDFGALDAPLLKIAAECALSLGTAGL
jgi:hypothetical protein